MNKFQIGDQVEGGEGDDHDTGRVQEISADGSQVFVAWQSGVSTWTPMDEIEAAE